MLSLSMLLFDIVILNRSEINNGQVSEQDEFIPTSGWPGYEVGPQAVS